jgi:hypothetical protein
MRDNKGCGLTEDLPGLRLLRNAVSGATQRAQTQPRAGHALVSGAKAQRAMVYRLQGRVSAG